MKGIPSITGLRAVSIIIVILFHLFRFNIQLPWDQDTLARIPILNGRFGVNVFFVISGFLITALLLEEERDSGGISIKNFYARRTLRIFPAYFFLLLVYWVLQMAGYIRIQPAAWLTALTYTKYFNYKIEFYTSHIWSLSVEEHFYLFWPLVVTMGDKARKNMLVFLLFLPPLIRSYTAENPVSWMSEQSIFCRIDSIATGCLFAIYKKDILAWMSSRWKQLFYGSLVVVFLLPWVEFWVKGSFFEFIFIPLGGLTGPIANVAIAFIMMYSVYGTKGPWYRLLNSKVMNYIGLLSYSLYLWQQLFIARRGWWVTHVPQNIIITFLVAAFSYHLIEKPFLRLRSRFKNRIPALKPA